MQHAMLQTAVALFISVAPVFNDQTECIALLKRLALDERKGLGSPRMDLTLTDVAADCIVLSDSVVFSFVNSRCLFDCRTSRHPADFCNFEPPKCVRKCIP